MRLFKGSDPIQPTSLYSYSIKLPLPLPISLNVETSKEGFHLNVKIE
jgi:hypothetical protein